MRYLALLVLLVAGCGSADVPPGAPTGRTFASMDGAVPGTTIEVRFTNDHRLVLNAGCNTLTGEVLFAGGKISVPDAGITEMGCDPARHAQDQRLTDFVAGRPEWRLDGTTLVLSSSTTRLVLPEKN
jgi:heat shock protein HslJ